jgi:NAD(P)-dependent dehydrogenase (short-subunit alcohol dehydrogenase family)
LQFTTASLNERDFTMTRFTGKTVFISGASSGIGKVTALAFAAEGAQLALIGRRQPEGEATAQAIRDQGGKALFIQADVTQEAAIQSAIQQTVQHFGRLDVAFNNAGVTSALGPLPTIGSDSYYEVLDGNLTSVFYAMKYQLEQMGKQGSGVIINNASIAGVIGMPNAAVYVAAKHGLIGLSRSAALEYAQANIRVNVIAPGGVDTPMFRSTMGATDEGAAYMASLHPMGRVSQPEEIAKAVLFLASDDSSFITGATLMADGGFTAR